MSFGAYPVVTLALARARHIDARKLLETRIDPMEQRKADKVAQLTLSDNSLQSVTSRWLEHWKDSKSPLHADCVK